MWADPAPAAKAAPGTPSQSSFPSSIVMAVTPAAAFREKPVSPPREREGPLGSGRSETAERSGGGTCPLDKVIAAASPAAAAAAAGERHSGKVAPERTSGR